MIAASGHGSAGGRAAWLTARAAVVAVATTWAAAARADAPDLLSTIPDFTPDIEVKEVAWSGGPTFPAPLWTSYALTEALIWGRDNQAADRPLIVSESTGAQLLSASDLRFPFGAGVRAFYGQRAPDRGGWELGYFGVYGQSATRTVVATPPDFLQVPDPIGGLLTVEGEAATVRYNSVINGAELNLFTTSTEWRNHSASWMTVDWLAGFRYVGVEEQAAILVDCCVDGDDKIPVSYAAATRNNLFGAQIGNRTRWTWENWAFEGWAKAGLFGNAQEQIQPPLVDVFNVTLRDAISTTAGRAAFVGDLNASLVYRLTDAWGIRAGYSLMWIEGLALAADQFDFTNTAASGTALVSGGGIFMHGANLGLEARW